MALGSQNPYEINEEGLCKDNPNRETLLRAFSRLMEEDLYGIGI